MSPGCTSSEDQIRGGNCRSGSAAAEIRNSGAGAVKGDWGSAELVEEEAAKELSLTAQS